MPSSIPNHKFLIDENVKRKLYTFLKANNLDVKLALKATSDKHLAAISKTEKRVLITNDEDFTLYTKEQVFSIIWLKIPQSDTDNLLLSFANLLQHVKKYSGKLIILQSKQWEEFPLGQEIK